MSKAENKLKVDEFLTQLKADCYKRIDDYTGDIDAEDLVLKSIQSSNKTQGYGQILVEQVLFAVDDDVALPLFPQGGYDDEN